MNTCCGLNVESITCCWKACTLVWRSLSLCSSCEWSDRSSPLSWLLSPCSPHRDWTNLCNPTGDDAGSMYSPTHKHTHDMTVKNGFSKEASSSGMSGLPKYNPTIQTVLAPWLLQNVWMQPSPMWDSWEYSSWTTSMIGFTEPNRRKNYARTYLSSSATWKVLDLAQMRA